MKWPLGRLYAGIDSADDAVQLAKKSPLLREAAGPSAEDVWIRL